MYGQRTACSGEWQLRMAIEHVGKQQNAAGCNQGPGSREELGGTDPILGRVRREILEESQAFHHRARLDSDGFLDRRPIEHVYFNWLDQSLDPFTPGDRESQVECRPVTVQ